MNFRMARVVALLAMMAVVAPATAQLGDSLRRARDQLRGARDSINEIANAADDVADAAGEVVDAAEGAVSDAQGEVQGTAEGATTGAVAASGGTPSEQVARMMQECTAKASTNPSFNTCATQCSQAAQYLGNVNMQASSSAMLVDRCTSAYSAAQASAAAAAESKAAEGVAIAAATSEVLVIAAPNDRFIELRPPSHGGLPRLGLQDNMGLNDDARRNKMSSDMVQQLNQERSERTNHLALYIHLVAASYMSSVLETLDKTQLVQSGTTPESAAIFRAQQVLLYIGSAGLALPAFKDYFCSASLPGCAKPENLTGIGPTNWGGLVANEFQRQAAYRSFTEREYAAAMTWARSMPREAYQVGRLDVGQYNFEKGVFEGHLYLFTSDLNRNVNGVSFAREGAEAGDDSFPYSLPVAADAAQKLVESFGQRPRHLYAARKIRFERLDDQQGGRILYFQYASPEVDLYTDEALKNKYMTVRVN